MNNIIDFFQNAWFVGIVGGIISGVIVYFLTNFLLDRKKKNEHKRNIDISNEEVLLILRPYIANSGLPSIEQLTAIINSISRRYKVFSNEMKNVSMFYEDLIVDFVSNVYISEDIKKQRIEQLLIYISEYNSVKHEQEVSEKQPEKTKSSVRKLSLVTSILSTIISITLSVVLSAFGNANFNAIALIISVVVVCLNLLFLIVSFFVNKKKNSISSKYKLMHYDDMLFMNHGTDLNSLNKNKFSFVDYFDIGE